MSSPEPRSWAGRSRLVFGAMAGSAILALVDWGALMLKGGPLEARPAAAIAVGMSLLIGPLAAFLSLLSRGWDRLASDRQDGEARDHVVRTLVVIGLFTAATLWVGARPADAGALSIWISLGIASGACWLLMSALILGDGAGLARRLLALVLEIGLLSVLLHEGGEAAAPWFLVYLWIVFDRGFRLGRLWLAVAAGLSAAGFAAMAATTPIWRDNWSISIGLLVALFVLPAYAATIVRRLSAERIRVEAAADGRTRLLGAMAGELKTPLQAMTGLADLMRGTELSREQATMLDLIRSAAIALKTMVGDLVEYCSLDSGEAVKAPAAFELPVLVAEIMAALAPEASRKGLLIGYRLDSHLPDYLLGFPVELRRLLFNLVGHAIARSNHGEIELLVDMTEDRNADLLARFEVRASGGGLDHESLDPAGTHFSPPDGPDPTARSLAVADSLARLIGGVVSISRDAAGGRLVLELAFSRVAQRPHRRVESARVGLYGPDSHLADNLGVVPAFGALGVDFVALGDIGDAGARAPDDFRLLIFDGRQDPVGALAAARRLGGRASRPAPATLVICHPGVTVHLSEMAGAAIDGILPWAGEDEILIRAVSRLVVSLETPMGEAVPLDPERERAQTSAEAAPLPPAAELTPAQPAAESGPALSFRILVAEDNQTNRMVLERILTRAGHTVRLVADGADALTELEEGGYDAAILDLHMPDLSGYHVAKLYRQMELGSEHLPLIGLTTDATSETARLCREAGMDATLVKPVGAEDALTLLNRLIERTPQQRRPAAAPEPVVVTPITAHPRFSREAVVIDNEAIAALAALGDESFFRDVVDAFVADTEQILRNLGTAQADRDLRAFKDQLQAMRSSAVNVGAIRLCQALREIGQISADELSGSGAAAAVSRIRTELATLRAELGKHLVQRRPAE